MAVHESAGRRKKNHAWKFLIVIIVLALAFYAVKYFVYDKLVEEATQKVTEQTLADAGVDSSEAEDILNNMSDSDRNTVERIIKNHADSKSVSKALKYISSGDTEGLREYASTQLTDEEMQELEEIYAKYY
jgi:flagellar basal body-associated protein FliL